MARHPAGFPFDPGRRRHFNRRLACCRPRAAAACATAFTLRTDAWLTPLTVKTFLYFFKPPGPAYFVST